MIQIEENQSREENDLQSLNKLIDQVEWVLRTKNSKWTDFISPLLREEAVKHLNKLSNLYYQCEGGFNGANRQRILLQNKDRSPSIASDLLPMTGVRIEGNFFFERPKVEEFRRALYEIGVDNSDIGDIWITNDRGAQGICSIEASIILDKRIGNVKDVEIQCEKVSIEKLNLPTQRAARYITTIEASTRIDSIASAGFGLSRSKIAHQIKEGLICLNWKPFKQLSKSLVVGDKIQHESKGKLEIISIEATKRKRWRIKLLRS